jgi:hypothetical protein
MNQIVLDRLCDFLAVDQSLAKSEDPFIADGVFGEVWQGLDRAREIAIVMRLCKDTRNSLQASQTTLQQLSIYRISEAAVVEKAFKKYASAGKSYADLGADKFGRIGGRWPPLWVSTDWSTVPDSDLSDSESSGSEAE